MSVDILLWTLGLLCAAWCVGLAMLVTHLDRERNGVAIRIMHQALRAILERNGELHLQPPHRAERPE